MSEFPALSFDEIKKQAIGFAYGAAVTVLVAVATDLSGIAGFEKVTLAGLGLTATRSLASFVVAFFTTRNSGGK